jgi:hypothetical protein
MINWPIVKIIHIYATSIHLFYVNLIFTKHYQYFNQFDALLIHSSVHITLLLVNNIVLIVSKCFQRRGFQNELKIKSANQWLTSYHYPLLKYTNLSLIIDFISYKYFFAYTEQLLVYVSYGKKNFLIICIFSCCLKNIS